MEDISLDHIQERISKRQYLLTGHAEGEREADSVTIREIEEALLSIRAQIIESYPYDIRGRSCLVLGFTDIGNPLHVVCGLRAKKLVLITVYRPDPEQWMEWKTRRKT